MRPSVFCFISLFTLLIFLANTVQAQEKKTASLDTLASTYEDWSKYSFTLGGFFAGYDSGITIGSDNLGLGVIIDLEDALGINSSTWAFRGNANYRFGKKSRSMVSLGYFGINRNSTKILEKELDLGGIIYAVGTEIKSKYNFSIIRFKYNYSFIQDKRVSLGVSAGLFIMPLNFRVEAQGTEAQTTQFVAPLPLVGLRTDIRLTPKFNLRQATEILYIALDSFEGSLLDLSFLLEYALTKNFNLGLGINSNRLSIRVNNEDAKIDFFGDIRMSYTGALAYVRYSF